jgi:hypothetical protein
MHIQAVATYRPWFCGSINRGIVKVHMSHFLTAYLTDPVPESTNTLTCLLSQEANISTCQEIPRTLTETEIELLGLARVRI